MNSKNTILTQLMKLSDVKTNIKEYSRVRHLVS